MFIYLSFLILRQTKRTSVESPLASPIFYSKNYINKQYTIYIISTSNYVTQANNHLNKRIESIADREPLIADAVIPSR